MNEYTDANFVLDGVPAMEDIQMKDMPSFIRTTDPNDFMVNHVPRLIHKLKEASAIIFNSYDALEHDVLQALSSFLPPLYTLGSLQFLLNSITEYSIYIIDEETKSITTNLWKEDTRCLEWLDSFEPNSVVYVN